MDLSTGKWPAGCKHGAHYMCIAAWCYRANKDDLTEGEGLGTPCPICQTKFELLGVIRKENDNLYDDPLFFALAHAAECVTEDEDAETSEELEQEWWEPTPPPGAMLPLGPAVGDATESNNDSSRLSGETDSSQTGQSSSSGIEVTVSDMEALENEQNSRM